MLTELLHCGLVGTLFPDVETVTALLVMIVMSGSMVASFVLVMHVLSVY